MQKYLKNNKGFTLVEVIVVAAIVLILAAVAIPMYMGYVRDSRQAAASNAAGSIATFMGTANQIGNTVAWDLNTRTFSTGTAGQAGTLGTFTGATQVVVPNGFSVAITDGQVIITSCTHSEATATVRFASGATTQTPNVTTAGCS
ncbi:MAG: prepilin-type N-terminal cleavage/methylation domain-containing protein [Chitinispirillales bacterium]|jgi:type IV pilus assembly protein PilA|nr:prepilin-type N-terminal cleavage/methylation domain-containing protein [Chitinispirillales bacterium]